MIIGEIPGGTLRQSLAKNSIDGEIKGSALALLHIAQGAFGKRPLAF
jgi:hypothetical protein